MVNLALGVSFLRVLDDGAILRLDVGRGGGRGAGKLVISMTELNNIGFLLLKSVTIIVHTFSF